MNKNVKRFGKGFVYGMIHPFKKDYDEKRHINLDTKEILIDQCGINIGQAVSQNVYGCTVCLGVLIGLTYLDKMIDNKPIHGADKRVDYSEYRKDK